MLGSCSILRISVRTQQSSGGSSPLEEALRDGAKLLLEVVGELAEVVVLVADDAQEVPQAVVAVLAVAAKVVQEVRVQAGHPGAAAQRLLAARLQRCQQRLVLL